MCVDIMYRPIVKRDKAFRLQAGKVVTDAKDISDAEFKRAKKATGYLGLDVFSKIGMDVTRQNLEDPMHLVANNVQNMFNLAMNIGTGVFSKKRRRCEVERGRFPELAVMRDVDRYVYIYIYIY